MKKVLVSFVLSALLGVSSAGAPAFAQSAADFGLDATASACTSGEPVASACELGVSNYLSAVAKSGLSATEKDDRRAELVDALTKTCGQLPLSVRVFLASVIREIGTEFDDIPRGSLVASISDALANGENVCTGSTGINIS